MTDDERLEKLNEAVRLLREVEFSYEAGSSIRRMFYAMMVEWFGITMIGQLMTKLRKKKWAGQGGDDPEYPPSNCVVCCKDCNFTKAGRYAFEEFCLLMAGLKEIKRARRT